MKKKRANDSGLTAARKWVTIRVTLEEKDRLIKQAEIAGLCLSEYMRRRFFGGRPLTAQTDILMVGELRRIGGLLKHNFETMRQANVGPDCFKKQEEALQMLIRAIEKIALSKTAPPEK